MYSTWSHFLILACFLLGCPTPASVTEEEEAPTEQRTAKKAATSEPQYVGEPVAVQPQFGYDGCSPLAESELLEGEVQIIGIGKGKDAVIIDDGDVKWVVSYDPEGVFAEFEKERVVVRGRQCEPRKSEVRAYHFEAKSIRVVR